VSPLVKEFCKNWSVFGEVTYGQVNCVFQILPRSATTENSLRNYDVKLIV